MLNKYADFFDVSVDFLLGRTDLRRKSKEVKEYVAIGTDLDGKKDVLGIWLGASESSKYWLSVLNGLKS